MPTAAVFLDIEKAFAKSWHSGLLYKWSELEFVAFLIKLIASFSLTENLNFRQKANFSHPEK
jgi:hypothetical protein